MELKQLTEYTKSTFDVLNKILDRIELRLSSIEEALNEASSFSLHNLDKEKILIKEMNLDELKHHVKISKLVLDRARDELKQRLLASG
jgi:hypothetical protein